MNTREFLTAIWPSEGPYCVARPYTPPGAAKPSYAHAAFDDLNAVIGYVATRRTTENLFFAVHTLKTARVWDAEHQRMRVRRTHDNMKETRAFFFDLDVFKDDDPDKIKKLKYASQAEALADLQRFLFEARLPAPIVVSSGAGVHVYWTVVDPIASDVWRPLADRMYWLARKYSLKIDPMRTTDQSSILRIAGTLHLKDINNPRKVQVLHEGPATANAAFIDLLEDRTNGYSPAAFAAPHASTTNQGGNIQKVWSGRMAKPAEITAVCEHMREFEDSQGNIPEPHWYIGLGTIAFCEDGRDTCHKWSSGHPNYTEADTEAKIDQWEAKSWPPNCAKINATVGGDACDRCQFKHLGSHPFVIAEQRRKILPLPHMQLLTSTTVPPPPCEPKFPYSRVVAGIAMEVKDKSGASGIDMVAPYDMYPFAAFGGTEAERGFSLWAIFVEPTEPIVARISNTAMHDPRELTPLLMDQGVYFDAEQIVKVRRFMSAYLRDLRNQTKINEQFDHLGWVGEHDKRFVLYERLIMPDGKVTPCSISKMAHLPTGAMSRSGTLADQVKLMGFYNHPAYIQHQLCILASLASPFYYVTTLHGVVLSLSGKTGASKSWMLYTCASLWGHPQKYTINGTPDGATKGVRMEQAVTLANLPVCVDEITLMSDVDARSMVMSATQLNPRGRLDQKGVPKPPRGGFKSTMMICTANSSLTQLINTNNTAGQAGTVRVFEMNVDNQGMPHTKPQADNYMRQLNQNYGWLGEAFMAQAIKLRPQIEKRIARKQAELDTRLSIAGAERFWSAPMAVILVIGELAFRMGLHPYDMQAIEDWFINHQLPAMRGQLSVELERRDPENILGDYLEYINGDTIHVSRETGANDAGFTYKGNGELKAHIERGLGEIWVRSDPFRRYCERNGHLYNSVIDDLFGKGIVIKRSDRRAMGAGTVMEKARSRCFIINLRHPAIHVKMFDNIVGPVADQTAAPAAPSLPANIPAGQVGSVIPFRPKRKD